MLRPTDRPEPYTELAIGERSMPHRLRRFLSPTIPLVSVTIESVEAASPETMACFRIRWFCVPELTISTFSSLDTGQDRGSISGHRAVGVRHSRLDPPSGHHTLLTYAPPSCADYALICRGQGQTSRAWRETWPCPGSRLAFETPTGA